MTLFVSFIVIFRAFIFTNIVRPVALLFWALWRIVSSVNQNIYWVALIVLCLILILRILPFDQDISSRSIYNDRARSPARVEHWQTLIKAAVPGNDKSRLLRDSLRNLLISVISQDEQFNPIDLEKIIATGEAPISLAAQQYILPTGNRDRKFSIKQKMATLLLTPIWLRKWIGKFIHQDYTSIDETLRWMETELEINDEK
jgi:hypothetical protein